MNGPAQTCRHLWPRPRLLIRTRKPVSLSIPGLSRMLLPREGSPLVLRFQQML